MTAPGEIIELVERFDRIIFLRDRTTDMKKRKLKEALEQVRIAKAAWLEAAKPPVGEDRWKHDHRQENRRCHGA
jgi:hypothetical protein